MAPPHLHPRSRMTSSLFATTVVASFFVVALPHILPCPAPRRAFADNGEVVVVDANGRKMRRRRQEPRGAEVKDGVVHFDVETAPIERGASSPTDSRRECPIPRPGGVVGKFLGLSKPAERDENTRR